RPGPESRYPLSPPLSLSRALCLGYRACTAITRPKLPQTHGHCFLAVKQRCSERRTGTRDTKHQDNQSLLVSHQTPRLTQGGGAPTKRHAWTTRCAAAAARHNTITLESLTRCSNSALNLPPGRPTDRQHSGTLPGLRLAQVRGLT
ncbi:unnamed protein product, partial [Ectocarpus sp. 12 AP-2014]